MQYEFMTRLMVACIAMGVLLISGCASSTGVMRFTQSEVKLIPAVAMHKALSRTSNKESVVVRAKSLPGLAAVVGFEGTHGVLVTDEQGKESKIVISEITDIYRVRLPQEEKASSGEGRGSTAEGIGETLIYAPLIPVAVVSWPFLRAMGLDEHNNSQVREKAILIYGGMTKQELRDAIGEPDKRYRCQRKGEPDGFDVWAYAEKRVLRGGQFIFFSNDDGKVYFSSFRYPYWANCVLSSEE